jgi:hypothetical protein
MGSVGEPVAQPQGSLHARPSARDMTLHIFLGQDRRYHAQILYKILFCF